METQVDEWNRDNRYRKLELVALFKKHLANKHVFQWIGDWTLNPWQTVKEIVGYAKANNALFQIVLYNNPNRDTGGFSAGGGRI